MRRALLSHYPVTLLMAGVCWLAFQGPAVSAADHPVCDPIADITGRPLKVISPWPGPVRNPARLRVVVANFDEILRAAYRVEIRDAAGDVVYESRALSPSGSASRGFAEVLLDADRPQPFQLLVVEKWGDELLGICQTERRVAFTAGRDLPVGPRPTLRVNARFANGGQRVREVVGRDFGINTAFVLTAHARCTAIDDGDGNSYVPPRPVFVLLPFAVGSVAWDPCRPGPSTRPIGAAWNVSATWRAPLAVRAASTPVRRELWRVGFNDWPTYRGGLVEIRRSGYRRAQSRRIFSDQFDDYFNICIKQGREVWAEGGRVYCVIQTAPERAVATVRLVRPQGFR